MARPIVLRMSVEDTEKTRKALESTGAAGEKMLAQLEKASRAAAGDGAGLRAIKAGADDVRASIDGLAGRLGPLGSALSATGVAGAGAAAGIAALGLAAVKVAQAGDEFVTLQAKVSLAVGGIDQARDSMKQLFALSQQTGTGFKDTVDTFVRIQRAAADLGATRTQVAEVVSTIQKLAAGAGLSGQEVAAGMQQLGQALASGTLQGDELRSILENMPPIARAIATELGVSVGELRNLGAEGKITSETVFKAIQNATTEANRQFAEMPDTLEKSLTRLGNAWTARLAAIDQQVNSSTFLRWLVNGTASAIAPDADPTYARLEAVRGKLAEIESLGGKIMQSFGRSLAPIGQAVEGATGFRPAILGRTFAEDRQRLTAEQARLEDDIGRQGLSTGRMATIEAGAAADKRTQNAAELAHKQGEIVTKLLEEVETRRVLAGLSEEQKHIEEARLKAIADAVKAGFDAESTQSKLLQERYAQAAEAENAAKRQAEAAREINRLNEQTLRDVEKYVKEHEKREAGISKYIGKLEEEARLAGATNNVREEGRAILEAQSRLYDEQGRKVRDLTEDEKRRIVAAVGQREAMEKQRRDAEKLEKDIERTIVRGTDRGVDFAADALYDGFTGKITSVGEFLKTTLLRAAAQATAEMVFRPLIAPIVSAGVQAVAGAGFGSTVGINQAGAPTAAGGGLSLGNIGSAIKLGYEGGQQAGFWGNIFGNGTSAAGGVPNAVYTVGGGYDAAVLSASEAAQEGVAAGVGNAAGSAGSALGTALPIIGAAYSAYNFSQNPSVLSGIGAAGSLYAGASAGLSALGYGALPFAGPIGWAAAAVMLASAIFGGGKKGKPVVHADQTARDVSFYSDGTVDDRRGPIGYYGANPSMYDGMTQSFASLGEVVRELGGTPATYGFNAVYDSVLYGNQGSIHAGVIDPASGKATYLRTGGNMEALGVATLKELLRVSDGITDVYRTIAANSEAGTLSDFAKDLDFGKSLEDSVAAITDLGQALDSVTSKAKASAIAMVGSFDETQDRAEGLGLGDLSKEAIAKQVRAWMGIQGPQVAPSAVQTMLAQIQGAFSGLGDAGAKYGISSAEVQAANDNAIARVRGQFDDQIAAVLDPAGAALRAFDRSADQMRKDALDLGADLVKTEQAIARQRQAILDQQLGGLATNLRSFLDGQLLSDTSSLSPEQRLAAAQGQFDSALSGARSGDVYQASRLVGTAQELLSQGRSFYGSTADFAALEAFLRSTLQQFGAQQGFEGFGPAIQSQTSALINAQQLGTQALVDELKAVQTKLASLETAFNRLRTLGLVA
ncbi:MAG: tape measure protein [Alphaproteobacteria bacterium]|nr:tape measure protein [Alphaproteobacteria bacterium]